MTTKVDLNVNVLALEVESFDTRQERLANLLQLLGNNREYLDKDTVELIKAGPAALLSKAREVTLHHLVVDLIRAIVDNAKDSDGLGQILGRLCLACSGRAGWVSAELDVQGTRDGDPALIRERRDDETGSGSHVLVTIEEHGLNLANHALSFSEALNLFVVVSKLLLPIEVVGAAAVLPSKLVDDGTVMDILCDQGRQYQTL